MRGGEGGEGEIGEVGVGGELGTGEVTRVSSRVVTKDSSPTSGGVVAVGTGETGFVGSSDGSGSSSGPCCVGSAGCVSAFLPLSHLVKSSFMTPHSTLRPSVSVMRPNAPLILETMRRCPLVRAFCSWANCLRWYSSQRWRLGLWGERKRWGKGE